MDFSEKIKKDIISKHGGEKKRWKFSEQIQLEKEVTKHVLNVIKKEFEKQSSDISVVNYYIKLTKTTQSRIFIQKNLKLFISVFQALLQLTLKNIKEENEDMVLRHLKCVEYSLDVILELCVMSSTRAQLRKIFLKKRVLFPLCTVATNDYLDLNTKLHRTIEKIMFHQILTPTFKDANQMSNLPVFVSLKKDVEELNEESITSYCSNILDTIKITRDVNLIDFTFRELVSCLSQSSHKLFAVAVMLDHLKNITFNFNHEVDEKSLTTFLEEIVQEIINNGHLTQTDYNILKALADMNALILENKIEALLKLLLMDETVEENKTFIENCMALLLDVSLKLKWETKFVYWLLNTVKEVAKKKNGNLNIGKFVGHQFLGYLAILITKLGYKQNYYILKTIMHSLKVDIIEKIDSCFSDDVLIMFQTVAEILLVYFNCISIQDQLRNEIVGEKFISTMLELQQLFNDLLNKMIEVDHNNTAANYFFQLIFYWEYLLWVFSYHYDYTSTTDVKTLSVNDSKLLQLITRTKETEDDASKYAMYEYILCRMKTRDNIKVFMKDTDLSEMIQYWPALSKHFAKASEILNKAQMMELAVHILNDILTSKDSVRSWMIKLKKELLREDLQLALALSCQCFIQMKSRVKCKTLQDVFEEVNFEQVYEYTVKDLEDNLNDIGLKVRNKMFDLTFKQMNETDILIVKKYLEILKHSKMEFLSLPFKRIVFMLLLIICEICNADKIIIQDCFATLSDLLHDNEDKYTKFVHLRFFQNESLNPHMFNNLFICLLKKKKFLKCMKEIIQSDSFSLSQASTLLKRIESATPECTDEKAEQNLINLRIGLCEVILKQAGVPMTNSCQIKALTLSLKDNLSTQSVDENLKKLLVDTLRYLMDVEFSELGTLDLNEEKVSLLESTTHLAMETLQNNICLDIKHDVLKFIFVTDVVIKVKIPSLFIFFEEKHFIEYFEVLQNQLVTSHETSNKDLLLNFVLNWNDIIETNAAVNQRLRMKYLTKALVSSIDIQLEKELWEPYLQLMSTIINTNKLPMTTCLVDMCIMIVENCLRQCKITYCLEILEFCSSLFTRRTEFAVDRSSIIFYIYGHSVKHIIRESRNTEDQNEINFILLLNTMEKVTSTFIKFKKDIGRTNVYMISNIIKWYTEGFVQPYVKESIQICIGAFLSTCDQYGITFLRRCLPDAEQKIFDSFYEAYNKYYKFTGKI